MSFSEGRAVDIMAPIRASVVRYFALLAGAAVFVLLASAPLRGEPPAILASYITLLVVFAVAYRVRNSRPSLAGALCCVGPLVLVTVMVQVRGGISNPAAIAAYITLLTTTGLCWSSRGTLIVAILAAAILAYFVANGPVDAPYNKLQQWAELAIQLLIVSGIVRLTLRALTKSANDALAQEKRFQEAIEASPDGIIGVNALGCIKVFNRSAARLSGVEKSSARGKTIADLNWLSPESLKQFESVMLHTSEGASCEAFELSSASGTPLEVNVSLISHQEGESNRLVTVRDVTERARARQAQEALEARLSHSKSIDALGRLAGGVAHDFNNLLTVISGSAEMMRSRETCDERIHKDLALIEAASDRAAKLTAQLLAFGRKQVMQPSVLRPHAVLRGLQPMLERLVPANIELRMDLSVEVANVRVDESRLEQVIVNLVSNASDAMPDGGVLTISTAEVSLSETQMLDKFDAKPGDYVEMSISDTGIGIEPQLQDRLFEPFFTTKNVGKGTGLGLPMVQGIVAQSGGAISVESLPHQGATFRVYLPKCGEEATASPQLVKLPALEAGASVRVLLVEDEEGVREATERMLSSLGYVVEVAQDGRKAFDDYVQRATEFDLLVTDVVMPHLSGPELAERFRKAHPTLRVLFISGYTQERIVRDGVLQEGVYYLPKPFKRQDLAAMLSALQAEVAVPQATSGVPS